MTIEELAMRKVGILATLEGMKMVNAYGRPLREMAQFEVQRIELERELWSIEAQIRGYVTGATK